MRFHGSRELDLFASRILWLLLPSLLAFFFGVGSRASGVLENGLSNTPGLRRWSGMRSPQLTELDLPALLSLRLLLPSTSGPFQQAIQVPLYL